MIAAMAWMFAVMNGSLPGQIGHSSDHERSAALAMNMSGTEIPAHEMSPTGPGPGWITMAPFAMFLEIRRWPSP